MENANVNKSEYNLLSKGYFYLGILAIFGMICINNFSSVQVSAIPFLLIVFIVAIFCDRTELMALIACCVPFSVGFQYKFGILICLAVYLVKYFKDIKFRWPIIISFAFLGGWELLHVIIGGESIYELLRDFCGLILIAFVALTSLKKIDYSFIIRLFVIACIGIMVVLFIIQLDKNDFVFEDIFKGSFRFGYNKSEKENFVVQFNPNMLGFICNFCLVCILQLIISKRSNVFDYICIIPLVFFGVMTMSRAFLLCLAFIVVMFLFAGKISIKKKLIRAGIVLVAGLIVIVLVFLLMPSVVEKFTKRFDVEDISNGRLGLLIFYTKHIFSSFKNSMFGLGLQSVGGKLQELYPDAYDVCHNGIQQIVVAWGFPGLIGFGAFAFFIVRNSLKRRKFSLVNYMPVLLILVFIQLDQFLSEGLTLIMFTMSIISMNYPFDKDEEEQENAEVINFESDFNKLLNFIKKPSEKVASSLAFKMLEQFSAKGIGLIISIVLARLLSPNDFGQLAILTVFINLSLNLIQTGFGNALVQTKELGKSDYSTAFYINLAISFSMVVVLFFIAPLIGNIYNSDSLVAPLRFYSISLLFGAFNTIQTAKLQREMRFKASLFARLGATILSGGIGIALAYLGYGLWALVIYNFSYILLSSLTMFCVCRWLPKFEFSKERAKVLWGFGWKMLVSSLLCSIYDDIRALIIGKKHTTDALGYYNRGSQFPMVISTTIESGIQSVMFPVLSKIQDQKERLKETLKKSVAMGSLFVFPIMLGLAVVAKPLTVILLTEKWLPSVPYMQLFCFAYMTKSLTTANLTAIKSIGRSDVYMKLEIVRRVIMITILLVTVFAFNSVMAIIISYVISLWLDVIVISVPVKKLLGLGAISQFKLIWKIMISTLIMAVATYVVGLISLPVWLTLIIQIMVGLITYVLCCLLFREKNFFEILGIIKKSINNKSVEN